MTEETKDWSPPAISEAFVRMMDYLDRYDEMFPGPKGEDIHGVVAADGGPVLYLKRDDLRLLIEMWGNTKMVGLKAAVDVALAVYEGVPGQVEPQSDADALNATAAWLDNIDDVVDEAFTRSGREHEAEREIQDRLRKIAERLAAEDGGE